LVRFVLRFDATDGMFLTVNQSTCSCEGPYACREMLSQMLRMSTCSAAMLPQLTCAKGYRTHSVANGNITNGRYTLRDAL